MLHPDSILEVARRDRLTHESFNPIQFSKFIALQHVFWPYTSHLLPEDVRHGNTAFLLLEITRREWMTHVSFNPIQFLKLFPDYLHHIIFRRCSTWHYSVSFPWDRKTRSVDHVILNPIRFSKFIESPHVFWPSTSQLLPGDVRLGITALPFLEIARRDRLTHVSFNEIYRITSCFLTSIIASITMWRWQKPLMKSIKNLAR